MVISWYKYYYSNKINMYKMSCDQIKKYEKLLNVRKIKK